LNDYRNLGGQALIYGLGNVVPRILNYAVLTVYYTRRFSVKEYGIITELYAYVAIFMVLLTYGMETGLFKFSTSYKNRNIVYTTAFISVSITSAVFVVVVQLLKDDISSWIGYGDNPEYILYLALALALDAVSAIVFAKLRIENKVRRFAILKIVNVLVTVFFVFLFLEILPSVNTFSVTRWYILHMKNIEVGYVFIANVLASLFVLLLLLYDIKSVALKFDFKLYRSLLLYSLPLLIAGLAGIFNETVDRILMRIFTAGNLNSLYELGIYGANYRIAVLMTIFIQMFRYAAEPFFFNMYKKEEAKKIYANVLKYFTIFLMTVFLCVALGIDVFKYFIDKDYYEGLSIVPVVLLANVLLGLLFNVNMWYKLTGHTSFGVYITVVGAIITILLNVLLIPRYSYHACAWIHLLSNMIMLVLAYIMGQKYYKIDYDLKSIFAYIGLALCLYWIASILRTENIFLNLGTAIIFVTIYLIYCNKREKILKIFFSRYENQNSQ